MLESKVLDFLTRNQDTYFDISDQIWEFAELAYQEERSAQLQADYLESREFRILRGAGDVPNAFVAEWGAVILSLLSAASMTHCREPARRQMCRSKNRFLRAEQVMPADTICLVRLPWRPRMR